MQAASGQPIELLAHRGLWSRREEGNSLNALDAALAAGFGLETDVRDYLGEIVIAHDPPLSGDFRLRQLLERYKLQEATATLAINIKADGICSRVCALLAEFKIESYFTFDMSVPDMVHWDRARARYFTRHSDLEPAPALYERAAGVWLDGFESTWYTAETIEQHLARGKDVCVVSPELHRREAQPVWSMLKKVSYQTNARIYLCTDIPEQLRESHCSH